jgi:hypothetical protein
MTINLSKAYFCLDCEQIGDNAESCHGCASTTVHPISSWINREADGYFAKVYNIDHPVKSIAHQNETSLAPW